MDDQPEPELAGESRSELGAGPETAPEPIADPPPSPRSESQRWIRIALLAVAGVALAALFWPRTGPTAGRRAGGFVLDETGKPVPLERELGPVTLVHFWASWCAPCVTEMPEILAFAREASNDRFRIVFVAVGDEPKAARAFFGEPDRPLYFDPAWEVANRFGTDKLPETHLVVAGNVVQSFIGATRWSDPAVRAAVQKWIATPPSATP